MDFPDPAILPLHISSLASRWGIGSEYTTISNINAGGVQTATANLATFMPISIPWAYPVNRVWWINGSTIGSNMDFGIYSVSGSRIYSTGSTAQVGISAVQYVTPATPFWLPAGNYYSAQVCSGTTSRVVGYNAASIGGVLSGMLQQAGALPLPATATFAALALALPMYCGITRTSSGF